MRYLFALFHEDIGSFIAIQNARQSKAEVFFLYPNPINACKAWSAAGLLFVVSFRTVLELTI